MNDPLTDLAQFADRQEEQKARKRRNRCALCNTPEARKAALEWWNGGGSSTTIAEWLKERYNIDRAPRTIRDCLNKHKGV